MRSLEDVLRQKEAQAEKLRDEIRTLRTALQIMEGDDGTSRNPSSAQEPAKSWP